MVDLPKIPRRLVTTETPQSSISPGDVAAPWKALARGMDQLGEGVEEVAKSAADVAGVEAVRRDEEGKLVVHRGPLPIVGDAGKVFERRANLTYLARLEPEMDAALTKMQIESRKPGGGGPEGFKISAEAYVEEISGHIESPLLRESVRSSGLRSATQSYRSTLVQADADNANNFYASTVARIGVLTNKASVLADQGDTTSQTYRGIVDEIGAAYRELGKDPRFRYPPERIESELRAVSDGIKVSALRANVLTTLDKPVDQGGGLDAAISLAETIRTDTRLNLDPRVRENAYRQAITALNQRRRADGAADQTAVREVNDLGKMAAQGFPPQPGAIAAVQRTVDASGNPAVRAHFEAVKAALPVISTWQKMNPAQLDVELTRLEREMREKGANEYGTGLLNMGRGLLKNMRDGIKTDPLSWASATGVMAVPPIDFGSQTAAADMRGRVAVAEAVGQHYGIKPQYLTPEERRLLETATAAGGVNMVAAAKLISEGFGDRASRVLSEVSKDAPVLGHMGGLISGNLFGGHSPSFVADVAEAVKLRQDKEFKLPKWLDHPPEKIMAAQNTRTREQYGDAFMLVPDTGRAAGASAKAAFFARANRRGYGPLLDEPESKAAYDRALQEAAGATYTADGTQYGGITKYRQGSRFPFLGDTYKVLIPANTAAVRFRDVILAIRDSDLATLPVGPEAVGGKAYTARDLHAALPVASPGGYRFALGDPGSDDPKWIRGADGQPFVLDLDRLEPVLRKRLSGRWYDR